MTTDERLEKIEQVLNNLADSQLLSVSLHQAQVAVLVSLVQFAEERMGVGRADIRDRAIANAEAMGGDTASVVARIHALLADPPAGLH